MRKIAMLTVLTVVFCLVSSCVAPRLGKNIVRYEQSQRPPTPESAFIEIFDSREDVPFPFKIIAEVQASPMMLEREFGHDPIDLLRAQAREVGGIGLVEVGSGEDRDSRHTWKGKVIARK